MTKNSKFIVLMGDIVDSRSISDIKMLHRKFNTTVADTNQKYQASIKSPLTITLGDEFQGIVDSFEGAFTIAWKMRLTLMKNSIFSRYVVGAADLKTKLNTLNAWNMMGPGLSETRELLNEKRDFNCYRFTSYRIEPLIADLLNGIGRSLTKTEEGWTSTQLKYVLAVINAGEKSKVDIASEVIKVSKNTLMKTLRSAHYQFYIEQIELIRRTLSSIDGSRE